MTLEIINKEGQKTGRSIELPDDIFAQEPNNHVLWLSVKQYLAAQRQGTHKVKTRAEVKGSSKKLHKQKGTGGSRKGNIRNPLYKGGGTIFGPKPHAYDIKLNKKVKDLGKISALSVKAKDNKLFVVEDECVALEKPSTKQFVSMFNKLGTGARKPLFILPEYNANAVKSFRNTASISGTVINDINTYDLLHADAVIFTEEAAKVLVSDNHAEKAEA